MKIDLKKLKSELLFLPLGGCGEIGMNLNLYHYDGRWIMLDCGSSFAEQRIMPGVDIIVPNIDFILQNKIKIEAIVITHIHEDHIGAICYLWQALRCPIYLTPLGAAFLKLKLMSYDFDKEVKIIEMPYGKPLFNIAGFQLETIGLTHSAPEMKAVAITTPVGTILHTGDWKLDANPVVGDKSEENRLRELGDEGVLAIVCDSTNVLSDGWSGSEGDIKPNLIKQVKKCRGMAIVTTFASNIARVQTIWDVAKKTNRKLVISGTSLHRLVSVAQKMGYLQDLEFTDIKEASKVQRDKILLLATGCQGEPLATIAKLSADAHPFLKIQADDTVLFSSKIIPGNEKKLFATFNRLILKGVNVITEKDDMIHVSGHPNRDELKHMYSLVRPKIAVPVHGEAIHLHRHCTFATTECGVKHAVMMQNGHLIAFSKDGRARKIDEIPADYLGVDGYILRSPASEVMKLRRKIMQAGIVICSVVLNGTGKIVCTPKISAPASLDYVEDAQIIADIEADILKLLSGKLVAQVMQAKNKKKNADETMRDAIKQVIRRHFSNKVGTLPLIQIEIHTI